MTRPRENPFRGKYNAELDVGPSAFAQQTIAHPVRISDLQQRLSANELLLEYVLAEPNSFVLAITRTSITPYRLDSKTNIETDTEHYRKN